MPRVGEQLADELHRISTELGHPGAEALWIAVRRHKLAVSKRQVTEYVRHKSEKQVLGAPQRAVGKSISEDDNRWMMDLIDVSPEAIPAGYCKFFLVAVNVFDRYMYARPLSGKDHRKSRRSYVRSSTRLPQKAARGRRSSRQTTGRSLGEL